MHTQEILRRIDRYALFQSHANQYILFRSSAHFFSIEIKKKNDFQMPVIARRREDGKIDKGSQSEAKLDLIFILKI